MNYFKKTLEYIRGRFFAFALLFAVPALLIGLFYRPLNSIVFLSRYFQQSIFSFSNVYHEVTGFDGSWLPIALAMVASFLIICYVVGIIDRDMRIGEFTLRRPFQRINEYFFVVLPVFIFAILSIEIINILIAMLIFLWAIICTPMLAYLLSILSVIVLYGLLILIFTTGLMWVPHMMHTGYSPTRALSDAVNMYKGKMRKVFIGFVFAMVPLCATMFIFLMISSVWLWLVYGIIALLYFIFILSYSFVVYYDINGIDREDLRRINIWKR